MTWTDEKIKLLKVMWHEGKTANEISRAMPEFSRNAVIGKAHRLKLPTRSSPIPQRKASPFDQGRTLAEIEGDKGFGSGSAQRTPAPLKSSVPLPETNKTSFGDRPYSLHELKPGQCRWPIGDPRDSDFHFCGAEKNGHRSYCNNHSAIAMRPGREIKEPENV